MLKYIKLVLRGFLELDNDYESLVEIQDQIIDQLNKLEKLEIQNQELILESKKENQELILESKKENQELILESKKENQELILDHKKKSYYDYLTLKNAIYLLLFFGFIGGGFWLYNAECVNEMIMEYHKIILSSFKELNANSINLNRQELKLLLEIRKLLLKKGTNENSPPVSPDLEKFVDDE
uniref:Orf182 n=1 Tax=Peronospora tabacina TaxID=230439 RepID=A0A0P0HRZ2_9STRA|nr:orf182 [Peronospora tabacina]ALJ78438.1 orf182 [Peronospora tabacina]ALJ78485.1 orf182 [Peronospora tabacina]